MAKCEGLTYVSDHEFLGKTTPGPSTYRINDESTHRRSATFKMIKPELKK